MATKTNKGFTSIGFTDFTFQGREYRQTLSRADSTGVCFHGTLTKQTWGSNGWKKCGISTGMLGLVRQAQDNLLAYAMQQGIDATVLPAMPQQKASPVQTGQFGQQVGAPGPVAAPVQAVPVQAVPVPVQAPVQQPANILQGNVAQFRAAIGAITNLAELQALYTAEESGKARSSVLSDLSQRIAKLAPVAAAVPVQAVPAAIPGDLEQRIAAIVAATLRAEREATLARAQALR